MPRFLDRRDAGRQLSKRLQRFAGRSDVLVVGLTRGGIPVAFEVARALNAPLETLSVRRVGVPGVLGTQAMPLGAIASGGFLVLDDEFIRSHRIPNSAVDAAANSAIEELNRRELGYRAGRPFPDIRGLTVIIVDDGLATGATMTAAVKAIRNLDPAHIIVAAPVGAADVCAKLRCLADDCVLALAPFPFRSVQEWYGDYSISTDEEVGKVSWLASLPAADAGALAGSRPGSSA